MLLKEPQGHTEVLEGLWQAAADERLGHALLFGGPDGVGKFCCALYLAAGLFCETGPGKPCGSCGPCRRFQSGGDESNHPDLLVVDPLDTGAEIIKLNRIAFREDSPKKDDVEMRRTVEGFLDLHAVESEWRVVIIRECHRMNANAQNALLKTLEEPSAGTLLILETAHVGLLLDTIISRVTRVEYSPLNPIVARELIHELAEATPDRMAERLARWSKGSPGIAMRLLREGRAAEHELVLSLLSGKRGAIECSRAVWDLDGEFVAKTDRAIARMRGRSLLDFLLEFSGDVTRCCVGADPSLLVHADMLFALGGGPQAAPAYFASLGPRIDASRTKLLQCRSDLDSNIAPDAVVDRAFLALSLLIK
jgi:hypothetical protein